MQYEMKPQIVDVFHWLPGVGSEPDPEWLVEAINEHKVTIVLDMTIGSEVMHIITNDKIIIAGPGTYIIHNRNGKIYAVTEDVFKNTFQKPTAQKIERLLKLLDAHIAHYDKTGDVTTSSELWAIKQDIEVNFKEDR